MSKRDHIINAFEASEDQLTAVESRHRTLGSLEPTDRIIVIDADHEAVAQIASLAEIFDMPFMQQVEATIREHHLKCLVLRLESKPEVEKKRPQKVGANNLMLSVIPKIKHWNVCV